ncbi:MAG: hypothetical protein KKA67_02405 [Spirochaetes bacterium]|nr:hypothetical protein [Spirochaetota bacterium]MBU1078977.1 hypothetical protein [Spirochaetota bacterium]
MDITETPVTGPLKITFPPMIRSKLLPDIVASVASPFTVKLPFKVKAPALDKVVVTVTPAAGIVKVAPTAKLRELTAAMMLVVGPTPLMVISSLTPGVPIGVQFATLFQSPSPVSAHE